MSLRRFFLASTRALVSTPIRSLRPRRFLVLGVALACGGAACVLPLRPAGAALSNVRVDPSSFSPNADGVRDSVHLRWASAPAPESLRVEIRAAAQGTTGAPLRAYSFGPQPAGAGLLAWDGRDDAAALLAEGRYLLRVRELTAAGGTVTDGDATASVVLDLTAPPVPVFDDGIDLGDTTAPVGLVGGIASQADSVTVFLGGQPKLVTRVSATDSTWTAEVPIVEGPNAIAAQSFDRAGNRSPLSGAVTITYRNTPDIQLLRASPFESSPNADGVLDTVYASFSLDAATTRLLVQARAAVPYLEGDKFADTTGVRTLHEGPAAAGAYVLAWDGRDSLGVNMPEGFWWFSAQAESIGLEGEPLPGKKSFALLRLDRSSPAAPAPSPLPPARTTRNTVTFRGLAVDADSVLVWRGGTVVGRGATPRWTITVPLTLGTNTFTFEATEFSGNRSPQSAPVDVVYEEPLGFHAPERFTAADVFDVNLAKTGRVVRIDLFELGGRRVRTLVANVVAQRYELPWNLLDDHGRTLGDGPYVAHVTVEYADGTSETAKGAVVVAK